MTQEREAVAEGVLSGLHGGSGDAAPISKGAIAAIIALGCVALLMMGIQPVVLGALQAAGRLSVPAMGQAATVETLALGAVSAGLAARFRHRRLRAWASAGTLLLIAANAAGLFASGLGFVLSRGLAGASGGVLVWVATGLITRRHDASRINAIFLGGQALTQGAAAALIPITLGPTLGANSGLIVIAAAGALALPLALSLPDALPDPPATARQKGGLQPASAAALAAGLLMMAGIVGLWVYVEPIARAIHIPDQLVSFAIAASLVAQLTGAMIVVAFHHRVKPVSGLLAVVAGFLVVTAAFAWLPSQAGFVTATLAFGLLWMFALTLSLPLVLAADPTRRAALYGPASVLLGSSLGPLAAGAFATETDIRPALGVAATFLSLSALAIILSARVRRAA